MSSFDVVVPCYNYGKYLRTCVRSILGQDGVSIRVLIIDDASTDDSSVVAQRLAAQDDRVHFRRHESNFGHIATYNEGLLRWAYSDYALLISADDVLAPGALARAAQLMDGDPLVGLCFGREIVFSSEAEVPFLNEQSAPPNDNTIIGGRQLIEMACEAGDNPVPTPTAVVRTALQQRIGGYDPELPHTADLDMWLRFAAEGRVGIVPVVQAFKREHGSNMLKQFTPKILPDLEQRLLAFERALSQSFVRERIDGWSELLARARHALSAQAFWGAHALFERGETALIQPLLDFASDLNPDLRASETWRRFAWKRRLGPALWRILRPVVEDLRALAGIKL